MWEIEKIIKFGKNGQYREGFARFGFHDKAGIQYVLSYDNNWVGCLSKNDRFSWTIGKKQNIESDMHLEIELENPKYLTKHSNGSFLIAEKTRVYKVLPELKKVETLINSEDYGIKDLGNCEIDNEGNIWINEITGCKVWKFSGEGYPLDTLGNGIPGFNSKDVPFEEVQFSWIYDLRKGNDGNIYILDSKNYSVRMIDTKNRRVNLLAGNGQSGYSGDNGDALHAALGGNVKTRFDGPWSLSLDEFDNIYIGDTQNHVIRMINRKTNIIQTIAGNPNIVTGKKNDIKEKNPFNLNLPLICGLDYCNGRLFIPEWDGDLIVLKKIK